MGKEQDLDIYREIAGISRCYREQLDNDGCIIFDLAKANNGERMLVGEIARGIAGVVKVEKKAGKKKQSSSSDVKELFESIRGQLTQLLTKLSIYDHDLNVIHRAGHILKTAVEVAATRTEH